MAEEVDLRFLGEQMKRLQSDVRQLKSDMAQGRVETVKLESELVAIKGDIDAFRESVSDRFDQQTELIKSSFRALSLEIQTLKKN